MILFFIFFMLATCSASAQQWSSPMPDYPMILSANFAEARPSHLHSGIDIKTGGVEGRRVVAVRDGYVSRIGVQPYGFGRVLYITHEDGTVSVYAHLSKFIPSIETYLKKMRYEKEINNIDLFPVKDQFRFKKGELIAYSGNSGSSGGPHLHFEIRHGADQRPMNIIHEGMYEVTDGIKPLIVALHFFAADTIDGIPMFRKLKTFTPQQISSGRYTFSSPLILPCKGYFALEVTDRKDGTQNTMGIYNVMMMVDGEPRFQLTLDDFAFSETRYVNSLMVYDMQKKSRNEIIKLARSKGNNFSGLTFKDRSGVVDPSVCDSVVIEVMDDTENTSTLSFAVLEDTSYPFAGFQRPDNSVKVMAGKAGTLSSGDFTVDFKAGSLFDDCFMDIQTIDTSLIAHPATLNSQIYCFSDENTPFFTSPIVSFSLPEIPSGSVIARYTPTTGRFASIGGKIKGDVISASTATGGCFCVMCDTVKAKIVPLFPKGFSWASSSCVKFKISDNFSGVASYSLKIDGKFAILEHELKKGTLVHYFDNAHFGTGKQHKLVLSIRDGAGNLTVYTKTYQR